MGLLRFLTCGLLLAAGAAGLSQVARPDGAHPAAGAVLSNALAPTAHAPLPTQPSQAWLAPVEASERRIRSTPPFRSLLAGIERLRDSNGAPEAVTLINPASFAGTEMSDYAEYYAGVAQLRAERLDQARQTLGAIRARRPQGYLYQAAAMREADAAEAQQDFAAARRIYEELTQATLLAAEAIWYRLGRMALATGDRAKAAEAFAHVYYEFPLADVAAPAATELASLSDVRASASASRAVLDLELGRAERLYGARRYAEARAAFEPLRGSAGGDQRELADLRLAECDFYLGRYAAARDGMRPYLERASRVAEARFFYLTALREVGAVDEFITRTRDLARDFPDSSWAEEALNNLATHDIKGNDDAAANETFRQLYTQFPGGRRAERAGWKVGWWAYRNGDYAEAIRVFESVAARFPRSDYRPSVLYWAARAHDKLGAGALATERYTLVTTDYLNSYYGRLAAKALKARREPVPAPGRPAAGLPPPHTASSPSDAAMPPTHALIRRLLALGLYDDALMELQYAQRIWGTSPSIEATMAYVYYQQGDLRRAITVMKRAYPQFLTSEGERLPPDVLKVMFPLDYWDIIRRHSTARGLDPYVIAALAAQESTFIRDIRSPANAYGLMQIVPATGRRLAGQVGIRRFTTAMLTTAEINVRLGTLYFAGLVRRFGGTHHALASYNAGENRIVRWIAERPGLEQDEFIDDIPFPETQNYVKRVLGTAEDYRRLYGELGLSPRVDSDTRMLAGTVVPPEPARPRRRAGKGKAKKPAVKRRAPSKKPNTTKPATKKPATKKPARSR